MLCTHFLLTEYTAARADECPDCAECAPLARHAQSQPAVVRLPAPDSPPSIFRRYARRLARVELQKLLYCA